MVKQSKVVTLQLEEPEKRKNTVETRIHLKMFLFRWTDINIYVSFIPNFRFLLLLTTKLRTYYVIFVYILKGKMEKKWKENHATKVIKIQKNMG